MSAEPWYDTGVLKPHVHHVMVQNRFNVAARSGLGAAHVDLIWTSLPKDVTDDERAWLLACCRKQPVSSIYYSGDPAAARTRFLAYTGYLIRNFTDGRIMPVADISDEVFSGGQCEASVLMIPDFIIAGEPPRHERVRANVLDVLRKRLLMGQPTILYVGPGKTKPWGEAFHAELDQAYEFGGDL